MLITYLLKDGYRTYKIKGDNNDALLKARVISLAKLLTWSFLTYFPI
jgi:hypothetical protein